MSQNDFFFELLLQRKLSFIRVYTLKRFGGLFDTSLLHTSKISRLSNKQHFTTFLYGFYVWAFKMEFNILLNFYNTGIKIIEKILFCCDEHSKHSKHINVSFLGFPGTQQH